MDHLDSGLNAQRANAAEDCECDEMSDQEVNPQFLCGLVGKCGAEAGEHRQHQAKPDEYSKKRNVSDKRRKATLEKPTAKGRKDHEADDKQAGYPAESERKNERPGDKGEV